MSTNRLKLAAFSRIRDLGIVGRLAISFIAVTVLAVAANFMVDRSDITQSIRVQRVSVAPAPPLRQVRPMPPASLKVAPAIEYSRTLELFAQAVLDRMAADTPESHESLHASAAAFAGAAATMGSQIQSADAKVARQLIEASSAVNAVASALLYTSDERRVALTEYRRHLDLLAAKVQSPLKGQYLLQLADDLQDFRARFDQTIAAETVDSGLSDMELREQRFKAALDANDSHLSRDRGWPWIESVNRELTALAAERQTLQRLVQPYRVQREALTQEKIAAITVMERGLAAVHTMQIASAVSAAAPQTLPAPAVEHELPPIDTITVTPRDRSGDDLIGWITGGVTVMVFFISLITVRSIVRPVRRLVNAAERLAQGDMRVRVQRGGLRELDELAGSFNRMAEDLTKANEISRFYQARLESDVAARTLELKELAEHDPLTQLPNRRHWLALMGESLASAQQSARRVGVFFIDLDNFKTINDSLGHAFGDKILCIIAERLRRVSAPFGYAARLGGDEFSVIYGNADCSEEIHRAGVHLVEAFHAALQIEQRELTVSVSVGLSIFPSHGATPDELLSAADAALFRAKFMGRNRLNVFTPDLLHSANEKFTIEQRLRRAIERRELELVYQPEISLASLKVVTVEALLRWRQPDGHLAAPAEFLDVAESSGFIADIDTWVMRTAIEAAAAWHHGSWPEARVAVNVSARQLMDAAFLDRLQELLATNRLPARCIEIELTETVLQTGAATIQTLHRLKEHGIAVALDDFGTGYSSLTSLEQLPLSRVKLDRSLIAGLGAHERSGAIARAIITLCQNFQLEVTAEGVETEQQLAWLLRHRSISLQGYLITRPINHHEVLASLDRLHQQISLTIQALAGSAAKGATPALFIAGTRK